MSSTIEERVTVLESQVTDLMARLGKPLPTKDWRKTLGMFTGNEAMRRIDDAALRYREEDRERAHQEWAKEDEARS